MWCRLSPRPGLLVSRVCARLAASTGTGFVPYGYNVRSACNNMHRQDVVVDPTNADPMRPSSDTTAGRITLRKHVLHCKLSTANTEGMDLPLSNTDAGYTFRPRNVTQLSNQVQHSTPCIVLINAHA